MMLNDPGGSHNISDRDGGGGGGGDVAGQERTPAMWFNVAYEVE